MKKVFSVVGARPQFIKAAVISRLIKSETWSGVFNEKIINTGQHYDTNMSSVFFEEMDIPSPSYNLNVGSGTHGKMTAQMLTMLEEIFIKEMPDIVLLYGDTNSTLSGALAASKLNIPIAHVEAGLRSFWKVMPEEQNRVITDHLSKWLFCPTVAATDNLKNENITEHVYKVGDIMFDAHLYYRKILDNDPLKYLKNHALKEVYSGAKKFLLATIHRAENTDNIHRLKEIIRGLSGISQTIVLPLHPRTKKVMLDQGIKPKHNVIITDPVSYLEMLWLELNCDAIITDSGGVQKEAYFSKKQCITLRDQTEWIETVHSGWNTLVGADYRSIIDTINHLEPPKDYPILYGEGNSGDKILSILQVSK